MHEPITLDAASRELAVRFALREGHARVFGRELMGLAQLEPAPPGPMSIDDMPEITTSDEARTIAIESAEPLEEPERAVVVPGIDEVAWWREKGAFGIATELGVALKRAGCLNAEVARRYANLAGEWIAHQMTLAPVTSTALPFVLSLLEHPELRAGDELGEWLRVIADAAVEEPADLGALRAEVDAMPAEIAAIIFPDGVEARHQEGLDRAREVRAVLKANRPRIERLAVSSEALAAVLGMLG